MEYTKAIEDFNNIPSRADIERTLAEVRAKMTANLTESVYRKCFSSIDLTSLESSDSQETIKYFTEKIVNFPNAYPGIDNMAAVCVYPNFVETAGLALGSSSMSLASVAGGFPSSQTFIEVKMLETAMAVEQGADEVDVVISIGELIDGQWELAGNELEMIREEIGDDAILKVILESGMLEEMDLIYKASIIAMVAGADFIKTSTGKTAVSATPEAAVVMCHAIKAFHRRNRQRVGLKISGGIRTAEDAVLYYTIVEQILGDEWLNPELFRIGASSLANNLLGAITGKTESYF